MSWTKLNRHQQNTARRLSERLYSEGVSGCTVSQVAKYLDDAQAWRDGSITLADLCERAGWDAPTQDEPEQDSDEAAPEPQVRPDHLARITERAARIRQLRTELSTELAALRDDIVAADKAGEGRNAIARAADGGLSKPKVYEHLGQTDILGLAQEALASTDLPGDYPKHDVRLEPGPGGRVELTLRGPSDTNRIHLAREIESRLKKQGLYLWIEGALPPVERLANGTEDTVAVEKK